MTAKTRWPLLNMVGMQIRYLLMAYLAISQLINIALFLVLLAVVPAKSLTPGAITFIIWLSAIMLNTSLGAVVSVLIGEHMQSELLDHLKPEPTRVILETRPGELSS